MATLADKIAAKNSATPHTDEKPTLAQADPADAHPAKNAEANSASHATVDTPRAVITDDDGLSTEERAAQAKANSATPATADTPAAIVQVPEDTDDDGLTPVEFAKRNAERAAKAVKASPENKSAADQTENK